MSKEKITALIDKAIGEKGPLRIPAYWMREVLNGILTLASNIEMSVTRLGAKIDTKIEDTKKLIPTKVSQLENDSDFVNKSSIPSLHTIVTTEDVPKTLDIIPFKSNIYYSVNDEYVFNNSNGEYVIYCFVTQDTIIKLNENAIEIEGLESGLYKFVIRSDGETNLYTKEKIDTTHPVIFVEYPVGEVQKVVNSSTLKPYRNGEPLASMNVVFKEGDRKVLLIYKGNRYSSISGIAGDEFITRMWVLGTIYNTSNAFTNCKNLQEVYIDVDNANFTSNILSGCTRLNKISGPYASSDGRCLLDKKGGKTIVSFATQGLSKYEIPEGINKIGYSSFNGSSLSSINIPSSVSRIDENAFKNCTYLKSVYISDLAKWCTMWFYRENSTNPVNPGNPLMNGAKLYINNVEATDIIIPDGISTLSTTAFLGCTSITSVTFGKDLAYIGASSFEDCVNLSSINFSSIGNLVRIYRGAFASTNIATISLPEGLKYIDYRVFQGCQRLTSVKFPSSIIAIDTIAFGECTSVEYYDFSEATKAPTISNTSFRSISDTAKIIVPDSLYSTWKVATNWSALADHIIKKSDWDAQQVTE